MQAALNSQLWVACTHPVHVIVCMGLADEQDDGMVMCSMHGCIRAMDDGMHVFVIMEIMPMTLRASRVPWCTLRVRVTVIVSEVAHLHL